MKKILLLLCIIFLYSCTSTPEGEMGMIEYEKIYQNRYETITVLVPGSDGNINILKYENIRHKDIHIDNGAVTFPDSTDHYITFVNCPLVITNP